jgi:hypothetical protein
MSCWSVIVCRLLYVLAGCWSCIQGLLLALLGCLPNHRYLKTLLLLMGVCTSFGEVVTAACDRRDGRTLATIGVLDGNCLVLVAVVADGGLGGCQRVALRGCHMRASGGCGLVNRA